MATVTQTPGATGSDGTVGTSEPGTEQKASRLRRGPRRRRAPLTTGRAIVVGALVIVFGLTTWCLLYGLALTPFQESRRQVVLYNDLREQLALQTAPLGGQIVPGTPVALITAPSIGMADVVVVEGTASGDLMAGPGHRRDTVLPGQTGVSVLYGRSALFGGPLAGVTNARPGDSIQVTTGQGVFTYVVDRLRRAGDPLPPTLAAGAGRLTLATAEGSGRLGDWAPSAVVYLDATLKGQAQPYPPGRPLAVPQAERAMQGDPSALLPLALALPLLLIAVLASLWAWARWGAWQTWLVGAPLCLAALWTVSQAAVQLLPNML